MSRSLERRKTGLLYYDRDNLAMGMVVRCLSLNLFLQTDAGLFLFYARSASFTPIGIAMLAILASIMADEHKHHDFLRLRSLDIVSSKGHGISVSVSLSVLQLTEIETPRR